MASSLAAVALLFLACTCALKPAQAKVVENIASSVTVRDDEAPHLTTEQVTSARDKMIKVGLRSTRSKTTFRDETSGDRMVSTVYKLYGRTSADQIVAHARVLNKAFPDIFTAADVQEIERLSERSGKDALVRKVLNNHPYISITFRQVSRADTRVRRDVDAADWSSEVSVADGGVGRGWCIAFCWGK